MIAVEKEVLLAEEKIHSYVRQTPLEYSHILSEVAVCQAFLKLENLQYTGSFKYRGALNKLLSLNLQQKQNGIIAASTGNHGLAVSYGVLKARVSSTRIMNLVTTPPFV